MLGALSCLLLASHEPGVQESKGCAVFLTLFFPAPHTGQQGVGEWGGGGGTGPKLDKLLNLSDPVHNGGKVPNS